MRARASDPAVGVKLRGPAGRCGGRMRVDSMEGTEGALLAQANELCQDPAFRNAVWRHLGYRGETASPRELSTLIHPGDQMLRHSLRHFREVNRSVSQYFNVALQQHNAAQQVFRLILGAPSATHRLLDFACGYGRLLRFLTLSIPPDQIWASEIQRDAVDFAIGQFGVHGILSDFDPRRFDPRTQFDFVWVASLFSHLPQPLFDGWLARLTSILSPRGILCFSVHDECLLPSHIPMPADGIHFISSSENPDLDVNAYGTTFVSEAFVRGAVARACGIDHPHFRISRGLANEQDLYIVPARRDCDLARLTAFRKGAWGWVDECRVSEAGELYMRGWAASIDDGPLDVIEIRIDGADCRCPTGLPRDDVRAVLNDARLGTSGWEFRHFLGAGLSSAFVEVTARSARDELALLYAGPVARPARTRA
jgi:SAM-dependent methyltransferase